MLWWMLGIGAALSASCMLWGSPKMAKGIGIGCVVAAANWRALGWITQRMIAQPSRSSAALLYVFKMIAIVAVIAVLLRGSGIDALGFAMGLSTMVVAILAGNLLHSRAAG